MTIVVRGYSADCDSWELHVDGHDRDLKTMVHVTTANGQRQWGTGCEGLSLGEGRQLNVATGSSDFGPIQIIASVAPDVHALVVTLSDGTREDVSLHGDPNVLGARVGVLVHSRRLDIRRIDLFAADGSPLEDETISKH